MSVNNKTAYISAVTDIAIQNRNFEFTMNGFHSNKLLMRAVAINTLLMQLLLPISMAFTPLISLSVRADELDEIMMKMRSAEILVESTTAPAPIYSEQPKGHIDNSAVPDKFKPSNPFIAQEEPPLLQPSKTLPDLGSENQTSDISSANKFNFTEDNVANTATQIWGVMGSENSTKAAESAVRGVSSGLASQAASDWLNQFGHARVQLNSTGTANADILLPLVESQNNLLFGQLGVRYNGDRTTNNAGLGVRQFTDNWMFGVNSFYDYDLTGKNSRLGAGAEIWTDNLKFSANGYFRLTDWHQSVLSNMEDYNERPANGFDVRALAYLPAYPQLGGSLMYEKYFGKGVALNGGTTSPNDLGDSPSALTIGANYTPIPLITVDVAHKNGQNTSNELQLGLNFNYRFGVPWIDQINKDAVGLMRSLAGSRYDLVDRNYNIVMQYQKQDLINLTLPATISAHALENVTLTGAVSSKYGTDRVEWSAPVLITAGGALAALTTESAAVRLPAYQHRQNINSYQVSAVAYDIRGNKSNTATTQIIVQESPHQIALSVVGSSATATADGAALVTYRASVLDTANGSNTPMAGMNVAFNSTLGDVVSSSATTDSQGRATVSVKSILAGGGQVHAVLDNGNRAQAPVAFIADESTATLLSEDLVVLHNNALANGVATNSVKAMVKDANGNAVPNYRVSFSADNNATLSLSSGMTGTDGSLTVTLTNESTGVTNVTATLNGVSQSVLVNFVPDSATATIADGALTILIDNALANGRDRNSVKAVVTDARGNPIPNQVVNFVSNNGASISASGTTGADGAVTQSLTNITAGVTRVTATTNGVSQSVEVNFNPDSSTATILRGALTVTNDNALANGLAANTVQAIVTDATGNRVPNQVVTFSANNSAVIAANGSTDADGVVTMPVVNTKAGVTQVIATINGSSQKVNLTFIPDSGTATILSGALTVTHDNAIANGVATNAIKAIVTDATGNVVPNQAVTFSADNNATIVGNGTTGGDGSVTVSLTNTKASVTHVTATVNGNSQSVDITFIADSTTATFLSGALTIIRDNALANGTAQDEVKAIVTDATGNVVPNQVVTFSANNNAIIAASGTTGADGSVTLSLTNATAGGARVTATVNSNSQSVDVTFIADSSTAVIISGALTVTRNNAIANGTAKNEVKAIVTDAYGNKVPNQVVTFLADNNAVIAGSGTTNSDGVVTLPLTNTTTGTTHVTATVNNNSRNVDVSFTADSGTATLLSGALTITRDNAIANSTAQNEVKAVVTDATGNKVPNQLVTFSANNNAIIAASGTTDSGGVVTLPLTNSTAGVTQVTATVNGNSQSVDVTFIPDSSTAVIISGALTVTRNNALANGVAQNEVKAIVTDATGNVVPNQLVTFSANNNAIIAASGTTDSDGVVTLPLTNSTAGVTQVTATVNGNSQSVDVTFIPDSSTAVIISGALTVTRNNALANGVAQNEVKAIVTDATGNVVPNQLVTFSANNNAIIAASGTTDSDGVVTLPLTNSTAGVTQVTATVNGNSQSVDVTFIADSGTATLLSGALTVTRDNALANGTAQNEVKAVITDATGNKVPNQLVTFSANNNALIAASATTDNLGVVTLPLTNVRAGVTHVTATVNGNSQSVDVTFIPDSTTATILSGALTLTHDNAIANGVAQNEVKAMVTDATGNGVPNQVVTFSANNNTVIAASGTTDNQGVVILPLTNTTAGVIRVTATVNGNSQSVEATFIADESTATIIRGAFSIEDDGAVANGVATNSVKAVVTDALGNRVPNMLVNFSANNNAVIAASGTTDANGSVTLTFTNIKSGITQVTAAVNNQSLSVDSTFIPDVSTAIVTIEAVTGNMPADGTAQNSVKAKVTDVFGNVIPNQSVSFSATNNAMVATSGITGADGEVIMTLISVNPGDSKVTATINSTTDSDVVTFLPVAFSVKFTLEI
ncbi:Ig-like domain-containing protein [Yersinia rochesterensis]|uniref:Ig-like domain-containing protein n=1 Tax=Yersinia rochesterensis TaxID=1604335 RepID=UPI0025AB54B1|nr:Ig-like domain-containing protein [Yersinia rochesterensis]MDN0105482.1 Ig-like domain-containing protein [Yersinia rochesterensis]